MRGLFLIFQAAVVICSSPENILFGENALEDKIEAFQNALDSETDVNEQAYLSDVVSVLQRLKYHKKGVTEATAPPKKKKKKKQKMPKKASHSANGLPVPPSQGSSEEDEEVVAGSAGELAFVPGFLTSVSMILVSELGDKTFFIAAIMAMKHSRVKVFTAAIAALAVMTVLSAAMGYALPALLPRQYTHYASMVLFLVFGVRLIYDATQMDPEAENEELKEVEEELESDKCDTDLEGNPKKKTKTFYQALEDTLDPIWVQTFTLTFLAEWGDRSQIATIALAAAKNPYGVTAGGIIGHSCCTGLAVVGGKMLGTRISERVVAAVGGVLFLIFAAHSYIAGPEAM